MNSFMIGCQGDMVVAVLPIKQRLTREEAINLAVWLVVNAEVAGVPSSDGAKSEFDKAYEAAVSS